MACGALGLKIAVEFICARMVVEFDVCGECKRNNNKSESAMMNKKRIKTEATPKDILHGGQWISIAITVCLNTRIHGGTICECQEVKDEDPT